MTTWKTGLQIATCAGLMAAALTPAWAVTAGKPDGNGHPAVVLLLMEVEDCAPAFRCSGTLLSATVLVTAGRRTTSPITRIRGSGIHRV